MVYYKLVLNDKRPKIDNIYPIDACNITVFTEAKKKIKHSIKATNKYLKRLGKPLKLT